jgi:hypothetical protein
MDEHSRAHTGAPPTGSRGHEERDVTFGPIVWAGAGMAVVTALIFVLVHWTFVSNLAHDAAQSPPANPLEGTYGRQLPPEPRLQTHPIRDLHDLRAAEDAVLNSYGWVDRKAGIVRIPIARAMALLAARGMGARPQTEAHP